MKTITQELKEYIAQHHDGRYGDWCHIKYDGRKKMFRGLDKADFKAAQEKHFKRTDIRVWPVSYKSELRKAFEYIKEWSRPENGNYQKIAVYGKRHLWACSPVYGHSDYNRGRLLEIAGHEKQCEWLVKVSERTARKKYRDMT